MDTNFYLKTRVKGVNDLADALLTPARYLAGGRTYQVVTTYGGFDHTYLCKGSINWNKTVKKIVAIVAAIIFFPLVVCGALLKIAGLRALSPHYEILKSFEREKWPLIVKEQIKVCSKRIEPTDEELEQSASIPLDRLITIGKEFNIDLSEWIKKKVPDPELYVHTVNPELAAKQLQRDLKLVMLKLETASDAQKRGVLTEIYNASQVCSPTWLEVVRKKFEELKGEKGAKEHLHRLISDIKEDVILSLLPNNEWNVLNVIRRTLGKTLGLDPALQKQDNFSQNIKINIFEKWEILQAFYSTFTLERLISNLTTKLGRENIGDNTEFNLLLKDRLPPLSEDEDEGTEVIKRYYTGNKLNEEGVKELLYAIGYIE